jgi:hypothetical protein
MIFLKKKKKKKDGKEILEVGSGICPVSYPMSTPCGVALSKGG